VANPFNDDCRIERMSSQYGLPVVSFGGFDWLLQHNFGNPGRWSGLMLRNWSNATINVASNYALPANVSQVYTDWSTSQTAGTHGISGYKDDATNGPNNIYLNYATHFGGTLGSLSNTTLSSSMMFYIPSWAKQVCLVAADYYRSEGDSTKRNSYWFSTNGSSSWTNVGVASWRGTGTNANIPENPTNNADMTIFNVSSAGYLLILESGYTINSVGFILLKP